MPWADAVYGCDGPWWKSRNGLPDFHGLKLAHDTSVCIAYRDVHKIEVVDHDQMLFDEPGVVGSGGNSGFQAINLAVQFGARRILLAGFDMHGAGGVHWYGRNRWKDATNPDDVRYVRWRKVLGVQAKVLARMGIEVVNVSPSSALTCFPHQPLDQALIGI